MSPAHLAALCPALLAGALLGGLPACHASRTLPVRKVLVDVEPAAVGVDREQVRAVVNETLKRARGIEVVPEAGHDDAAVLRVRVEGYGPQTGQGGGGGDADHGPAKTTLALAVELTSVPGDTGELRGHALASGVGVVDARDLVGQALRDALAQVLMTRNASELKSAELIGWLGDDSHTDDQKARAIRILGSRRERTAVAAVAKVLVSRDRELAPLALAALTNIGDPGAVDAVIAYSDRQPSVVKKQCIEAVRSMGSERAKPWLFTLSTGSPDLDVQEYAGAALAALEAQKVSLPAVANVEQKPGNQATP